MDLSFYSGKTVLVTGHTGFKGSWMARVLKMYGARVIGYGLKPDATPSLFELAGQSCVDQSIISDIRDLSALKKAFDLHKPQIVIHMAAQPIVRTSYSDPVYTYDVNVMGTVNVMECTRLCASVRSFVNVTTDKVYKNNEWYWGYRETDELNGYDPYSNSKSCSDLVTGAYARSFFSDSPCAISAVRAGNVIGGGDFAVDRIIPDCVRAAIAGHVLTIRNPYSSRPYQHVLEPVCAYLLVAMRQYTDKRLQGEYNVGPDDADCVNTKTLVALFAKHWKNGFEWVEKPDPQAVHEANFLKLESSKIKSVFGWYPKWNIEDAVSKTVEWTKAYMAGADVGSLMDAQTREFTLKQ